MSHRHILDVLEISRARCPSCHRRSAQDDLSMRCAWSRSFETFVDRWMDEKVFVDVEEGWFKRALEERATATPRRDDSNRWMRDGAQMTIEKRARSTLIGGGCGAGVRRATTLARSTLPVAGPLDAPIPSFDTTDGSAQESFVIARHWELLTRLRERTKRTVRVVTIIITVIVIINVRHQVTRARWTSIRNKTKTKSGVTHSSITRDNDPSTVVRALAPRVSGSSLGATPTDASRTVPAGSLRSACTRVHNQAVSRDSPHVYVPGVHVES